MKQRVKSNVIHWDEPNGFDASLIKSPKSITTIYDYKQAIKRIIKQQRTKIQRDTCAGNALYSIRHVDNGRPYYKIWPHIAEELTRTSLNVDSHYLRFPYNAFKINLPKDPTLRLFNKFKTIHVLVVELTDEDLSEFDVVSGLLFDDEKKPCRYLQIAWDIYNQCLIEWFPLPDNRPIEEIIQIRQESSWKKALTNPHLKKTFEEDFEDYYNLLRIIIGVSMFAIGEHEMIIPDIETPIIDRSKLSKKLKKQLKKREERNKTKSAGWLIGNREIDLPQPEYIGTYTPQDTGEKRELKFGYIKTGHMRWQPCGKGNKERKLTYIPPHPCRPDLPMRTHGYRIKDNIKRIS
jgi:hypothetical protein